MSENQEMRSAEEMYAHLVSKAGNDDSFRAQLVSDPHAVIRDEFGIEVPDSMKIQVHESDMDTVHLSLPPSSRLYEDQLEHVAGGGYPDL